MKTISKLAAMLLFSSFTTAGLLGLGSSDVSAFEGLGQASCVEQSAYPEEIKLVPCGPYFVTFRTELNLINESDVDVTFVLDGETTYDIPARQSLGVPANYGEDDRIDVTVYEGETIVFQNAAVIVAENCPPPVVQTIAGTLVHDCDDAIEAGFVVFEPPLAVDTIIEIGQLNGSHHGGPIVADISVAAGTSRYDFTPEQVALIAAKYQSNPDMGSFSGFATTASGSFATFDIGHIATNDECVEVGEPPVPEVLELTVVAPRFIDGDCTTVPKTEPDLQIAPQPDAYSYETIGVVDYGNTVTVKFYEMPGITLSGPTEFTHTYRPKQADSICNPTSTVSTTNPPTMVAPKTSTDELGTPPPCDCEPTKDTVKSAATSAKMLPAAGTWDILKKIGAAFATLVFGLLLLEPRRRQLKALDMRRS